MAVVVAAVGGHRGGGGEGIFLGCLMMVDMLRVSARLCGWCEQTPKTGCLGTL
jgi:hypothetical protein